MADERLKSGGWDSYKVRCPFWKGSSERAICCEGVVKGETIRRRLPNKEAKELEMDMYCRKNYELCKIFQLVYGGYK